MNNNIQLNGLVSTPIKRVMTCYEKAVEQYPDRSGIHHICWLVTRPVYPNH